MESSGEHSEESKGINPVFMLPIFFAVILAGIFAYYNSETYKITRAQKHYEKGEYTEGIALLFGIMEKSGPDEQLLLLASEGLRARGEEYLDSGDYRLSLPLFERIITINRESLGTGGSKTSILYAQYDMVIAYLQLAQDNGTFIEPYGKDIVKAEKMINESLNILKDKDVERPKELESELHFLASAVAAERSSAFWHENNIPQALVYLIIAEEQFNEGRMIMGNSDKFSLLREELGDLRKRIEKKS